MIDGRVAVPAREMNATAVLQDRWFAGEIPGNQISVVSTEE